MATPALNNRDPWGRSLMATLRRWWWIPLVLGLVGAVVGGLAGISAPKTAEALVRGQTANPDPQAVAEARPLPRPPVALNPCIPPLLAWMPQATRKLRRTTVTRVWDW